MNDDSEVLSLYAVSQWLGRWQKSDLGSREWGANTGQYNEYIQIALAH